MVEARVSHTFAPHAQERRALDWRWDRAPKPKLRLGYLSADFHTHPTTALLAEVIELHDRARFETVAYSLGPDDGSAMRARIETAFDRFHDLAAPAPRAAAERIHRDGIDILIDINGFTRAGRVDIVAYRPAPIQVNYLGFPGTMGADFIDYIVADDFICPPGSDIHYTEAIARLPDCYQPNDRKRRVAPSPPSRHDCGLPDSGFVFCCFNNSFKIVPEVFDVWMALLRAVPDGTLWLIEDNALAKHNLGRAASARGIAPDRLVFAQRIAPELHLARHAHADLFLDTLPYNAHTTACDALWAGLPVVTCAGETFAGRVAGSLLRAVGLPQCIAGSLDDYRRLALALATDRAKLDALKRHLAAVRDTCALFDSRRYTPNLERLYEAMWQNWLAGKPPAPIALETK
jgi:predicted O-linked N-acetylglucosamine transferase (SPINDLY family)